MHNKSTKIKLKCSFDLFCILYNVQRCKMGSGISITKRQIIDIIKRDVIEMFEYSERMRERIDENGYLFPETFDKELEYITILRKLDSLQENLSE